jgi:Glutamine amidotransferase domain
MGTRRLRIVDAERATQPQLSFDRRIAVAFNGEIYNHAELLCELRGLGAVPDRVRCADRPEYPLRRASSVKCPENKHEWISLQSNSI